MTQHTITLTEPVSDLLDRQMSRRGYSAVSDYIADLVRSDAAAEEAAADELRNLLSTAHESGISCRSLADILAEARAHRTA